MARQTSTDFVTLMTQQSSKILVGIVSPSVQMNQTKKTILRRDRSRQEIIVQDPNSQLRNAPKGVVAHRVMQSLQFKSSLEKYDHQRERLLFGKSLKDLQNEDAYLNDEFWNKPIPDHVRRRTNVSKLEPQSSILSYENALGLKPDTSFDNSVASQNLNKQKSMEKRNTMRITQESKSPGKKHNFFDT